MTGQPFLNAQNFYWYSQNCSSQNLPIVPKNRKLQILWYLNDVLFLLFSLLGLPGATLQNNKSPRFQRFLFVWDASRVFLSQKNILIWKKKNRKKLSILMLKRRMPKDRWAKKVLNKSSPKKSKKRNFFWDRKLSER